MKFRLNDSSIELHSQGGPGFSSKAVDPRTNMEYLSYEKLGQEIVEALTSVRQTVRDNIAAAKAPRQAVICPCCGASTFPGRLRLLRILRKPGKVGYGAQ